MKCPSCGWETKEAPWESWYSCANCDTHPETAIAMQKQAERIIELEVKNEGLMRLAADYIKAYEDLAFGDAVAQEDKPENPLAQPEIVCLFSTKESGK